MRSHGRSAARLFFALVVHLAPEAGAQDPVRPWLEWRTIRTAGYRIHTTPELEPWARRVAAKVESIDAAVSAIVGFTPKKPVEVVVDDPFRLSNGYAVPYLDRPVTVWWATPADPRNDIGNYRAWGEMLAIHEITHLAHMTRPSRNPFRRALMSSVINLGPIATRAPRWVYEGYATLVEGRVTGSGRPNNVWRPAILRQWAIEGRLPSYGQLNMWSDFNGAEFAYLGGSAFLEWLTSRDGDSSLVHVWRRLSARRVRTFEAAFAGVYGDAPALLYGRHTAELTRDAMAAKDALERAGLREGELIQRLAWGTGDPAISPNGERVAITLRELERPARVVVWKTAAEPEDTADIRRRIDALKRDPLDVPERRIYPRARRAEHTLLALNGRSYQMPRWFADNRRVLVTRWAPRPDGSSAPDLFVWDTQTGDVRRITHGSGVMDADPHPNSREAVALQCHRGRCDVAHVNLENGRTRTILEGAPDRTYTRARYSPDGTRIVTSVNDGGRWRLLVDGANGGEAKLIDPGDGANRYDSHWLNGDTLLAVSERGGVPNLELISVSTSQPRTLTRVTGAAVGPDVNRRDGSIWFLAMHSRGLDVRRLASGAPRADSVVPIDAARFGFAAATGVHSGIVLADRAVPASRGYGAGGRFARWMPGGFASADGVGGFITIFSGDVIGRLNATLTGAYGRSGTFQGASGRATWRYPRPTIELGAFGFFHEPTLGPDPQLGADSLDAGIGQGVLAISAQRRGDGWQVRARGGGAFGQLSPRLGDAHSRTLGFAEGEIFLQRASGSRGLSTRLGGHLTGGKNGRVFRRVTGSVSLSTIGRDMLPLEAMAAVGRVTGAPHTFERFTVGGLASPVGDSSLFTQRHSMPVFPTGVAIGNALVAWRVSLPAGFWTPFYEAAGVAPEITDVKTWNRAIGLETRFVFGPMPTAFIPRVDLRGGAGYTLSEPFKKKVRAFLEMRIEP